MLDSFSFRTNSTEVMEETRSVHPKLQDPPETILLGGLQGAGKGTNSDRLKMREGITTYVSSDEMKKHRLYPEVLPFMRRGEMAPNEKIMQIVSDYFTWVRTDITKLLTNGNHPTEPTVVFDGMPRNLGQKDAFDELLARLGREPAWAVKLHLDDNPRVADDIARASIRYRARRGAANGGVRPDDIDMDAVERRIKLFHEETEPLFDKYGKQGRLLIVDAAPLFDYDSLEIHDNPTFDRSAEIIYARVIHALNNRYQLAE